MTLNRFSILWLNKSLIRQFLIAATTAFIVELLGGIYQPARSESQGIAINMPMYGQIIYGDLITEAELLVGSVINDQFAQSADLSTVQVVVMGNRNGEVIPILTTTVSRTQWQKTPQVRAWTEYYINSYALLRRHEVRQVATVAAAPVRSTATNNQEQTSIDIAFDEGRLTGKAAQQYLDDLD